MGFKKILVATDLSPSAGPIYRWSAALARRFGSQITLINIDETNQFEWPARTLSGSVRLVSFMADLGRRRKLMLAEARDIFDQQGLKTKVVTVVGRASTTILGHVEANDVDLVVMGRRGARRAERFRLGSSTKRVLRQIQVPTLVVPRDVPGGEAPPEPLSGKRLIAATAFSTACMMNLDATLELAEALEAQVDNVHVIRLPLPFALRPAEWHEIVSGETREELEHLRAKDLSASIGAERAARCSPYTTIGVSVGEALSDLALETGADLVTIPSHSSGKAHPSRFGNTTSSVVERSLVPVLVSPVRYLERRYGEEQGDN